MLILYTSGYGYSKKRCTEAVEWFYMKYLKRYKIDIEVLHRSLKKEHAWGFCGVSGETYRPREFLIELDVRMNKELYLKTLFHELHHLFQWVKGELKLKASKRYYKGECVEDMEYWNQPHEIEAHKREQELYEEYMNYITHKTT